MLHRITIRAKGDSIALSYVRNVKINSITFLRVSTPLKMCTFLVFIYDLSYSCDCQLKKSNCSES